MNRSNEFTTGPILTPLMRFAGPVLLAMILQAMYGAVDLLVVGRFAWASDVSAVSTGSQVMHTVTAVVAGLSMGTTIALGQNMGAGDLKAAGRILGAAVWVFGIAGILLSLVIPIFSNELCGIMQAPKEAFNQTVSYVSICAGGSVFIVAYNVLGSIFRGMGDSKTPLMAVGIACIANILLDLLFVAVFGMATSGAALATVIAQCVSVALCVLIIRKRGLPFAFTRKEMRFDAPSVTSTLKLGFPIALQDLLVSISFLVLIAIVNSLGVIASAGVGVAEKLCAFIMLVPSAFSQSLSAFVAQNIGAGNRERASKAMIYAMITSLALGAIMAWTAFFHGDALAGIFTTDKEIIPAAFDYLRAYAIDTLLVSFLFCYIGYFNGCANTTFVMLQGLCGAFCVRIPVSWFMSTLQPVSLFNIGLATPCSTVVQIVVCTWFYWYQKKWGRSIRGL